MPQPADLSSAARASVQERYAPKNRCFGCGPANDKGLRIRSFEAEGAEGEQGTLVCSWTPEKHHEAFDGMLNGGICGALLDCHSNWAACIHLMKKHGLTEPPCTVTAEFCVKLKRPTPTTTGALKLVARVVESTDDSATIEAALEATMPDGQVKTTSTCRGVFVAVREGHPAFHRW
jgi:acyl-coenzyme A thioesterase PaaI-like protein